MVVEGEERISGSQHRDSERVKEWKSERVIKIWLGGRGERMEGEGKE